MLCGLEAGASWLSSFCYSVPQILREEKKKSIFCFVLLCKKKVLISITKEGRIMILKTHTDVGELCINVHGNLFTLDET